MKSNEYKFRKDDLAKVKTKDYRKMRVMNRPYPHPDEYVVVVACNPGGRTFVVYSGSTGMKHKLDGTRLMRVSKRRSS